MTVPTLALYASPSSVYSAPHQMNSHASYDLDLNARSNSSYSATPSHRAATGGLSSLFSTPQIMSANYSTGSEELGSLCHDRAEELGSSYRYSPLSSLFKRDRARQSPLSVLQSPTSSIVLCSRSPPFRNNGDLNSIRSASGGIFNGFVRHVLGSCVDYDSPAIGFDSSSSNDSPSDDITFNMEDSFLELDLPSYAKDLLCDAQSRHSIFRDDFVIKAFYESEKAHRGQLRASGHPYLHHCVQTAMLLANIGASSTVVAAGLLHDTVDDSFVTFDHIFTTFGAGVADLVEGVSKLSQMSKLARDNNTASKTVEADRLHTMFLAMADARAVLIKLADRLHNMTTLDALPMVKQLRFAKETSEIFVPLANRLGVSTWKEQLENLCFKHLNHDRYQELASKFVKIFDEAVITSSLEKLEKALIAGAVSRHCLLGRHKSLFSIHSKMLKKKLIMEEVHDIHGLRLIVETEEECYRALKVVHQLWHEVPGKFKDYIVYPKCNGYQSLHTVVMCDSMVPLEVQIRTKKMHLQAEYGLAAHWRYKEGECQHSSFVLQTVEWARLVISWQCEATRKDRSLVGLFDFTRAPCTFPAHSKDSPFSCKPQRGPDGPVYVIMIQNDKMSVQELGANSTVRDLLETAGGGCGFSGKEELRPRVNHEAVRDPSYRLKMGDVVELTPAIPDKSLPVYREEIQRMYDKGCYHIKCSA